MYTAKENYATVFSRQIPLIINFCLAVSIVLFSCSEKQDKEEQPKTALPCQLNIENFDSSFGIDYQNPEKYLIPGEQSDLDSTYFAEIKNELGTPEKNIDGINKVCHWVNQNFHFSNAGGSRSGKKTINELYESKTFYGCHSAALLISGILREFAFPTIMVETASIVWANEYNAGSSHGFAGHVMSEVYVMNKWILLDNNCTYVENYNNLNPFISMMNRNFRYYQKGLFVYAKGKDSWDYDVKSETDTHRQMINFASNINCFKDLFGTENYNWNN